MAEKILYGSLQEVRIKILDSINAGKNPLEILLEVSEMLGEISGEESFYHEISEQIFSVYGLALGEKFVLEKELEKVSERMKKIEAAQKNPDFTEEEHKRMGYALERHKEEIIRLERLGGDGESTV